MKERVWSGAGPRAGGVRLALGEWGQRSCCSSSEAGWPWVRPSLVERRALVTCRQMEGCLHPHSWSWSLPTLALPPWDTFLLRSENTPDSFHRGRSFSRQSHSAWVPELRRTWLG